MIYNPNFPPDSTLLKDIPKSIRQKGEEMSSLINNIETNRNTSNITGALKTFENYKYLFVSGNQVIPNGIYFKNSDFWLGYTNYNNIITTVDSFNQNDRITIDNQTYCYIENDENKIIYEDKTFKPYLVFDYFQVGLNLSNNTLTNNTNVDSKIKLVANSVKRTEDTFIPYILNGKNSIIKTDSPLLMNLNSLTFSAIFSNINREYFDTKEVINREYYSVLMFLKDEHDNVGLGLAYDFANNLYLIVKDKVTNLSYVLSENNYYSMNILYNDATKTFSINVNGKQLYSDSVELNNYLLYFGVGNDISYGRYANGSFNTSEFTIYDKLLTSEEIIHNKNFPRTFNLLEKNSYLDLTVEEKIKLKKILSEK